LFLIYSRSYILCSSAEMALLQRMITTYATVSDAVLSVFEQRACI